MKNFLTYITLLLLGLMATAPAQARPVVVELFTSEACSSCPPAEALLAELKKSDTGILPLSFHVTYWNGPAWTDAYALTGATERQSWYAGLHHSDEVYTPEAVVDGTTQMVGSRRNEVVGAIASAKAAATDVPVSISGGTMITIHIAQGTGPGAKIWLFGFDPDHTTKIGGGENGGATLHEVNVVRSITPLGTWSGAMMNYTMPHPAGTHIAVLLQADNGQILGAAAN
ncbi:MAG: hypothetical protein B7Z77_08085 [Acidocella sp. 20-58-15]|nr:MAG: hypothetical protein B7Z77_08085 [Acidocella sp. 20-58-15]